MIESLCLISMLLLAVVIALGIGLRRYGWKFFDRSENSKFHDSPLHIHSSTLPRDAEWSFREPGYITAG
jgi:hypothetical protein